MKRSLILAILLTLAALSARADDPPSPSPTGAPPASSAPSSPAAPSAPSAPAPGTEAESPSPAAKRWEDDLDSKLDGTPAPTGGTPPPDPKKKQDAPPPQTPPSDQRQTKPAEGEDIPQFKGNKELREWAVTRHKEAKRLDSELKSINAKFKELEAKVPKTEAQAQQKAQEFERLQKRIDEYEEKIRFMDYTKSQEYTDKYLEPYNKAFIRAYRELSELEINVDSGQRDAEGNPVITTRAATKEDFNKLIQMPLGQAAKMAHNLFKESAHIVMGHYNRVRELSDAALQAVEDYKARGGEIEKQNKARQMEMQSTAKKLWDENNSAMSKDERYKDLWGRSEDQKENEELDKGFKLADQLFGESEDWPLEDRVKLHVAVRHRLAGFYKLRHSLSKKDAEIAALNETIQKMKGSGPGPTGGASSTPASPGHAKSWEEELDSRIPG